MKYVLLILGIIFVGLGLLGVVFPLIPTVPFLLLAAACFARSSERMYKWLTSNRILGPYIENYLKYRALSRKSKIVAITMLWVVILLAVMFSVPIFWAKVVMIFIAILVTAYLLSLKTMSMADKDS